MVEGVVADTCLGCPYCRAEILVCGLCMPAGPGGCDETSPCRITAASYATPLTAFAGCHLARQHGTVLEFLPERFPTCSNTRFKPRKPWLAAVLSLLGGLCLGQFYNGQACKAILILAASVLVQSTILAVAGLNWTLLAATLFLVILGSTVDAFVSALGMKNPKPAAPCCALTVASISDQLPATPERPFAAPVPPLATPAGAGQPPSSIAVK